MLKKSCYLIQFRGMFNSPNSSLSSFRDHYEYDSEQTFPSIFYLDHDHNRLFSGLNKFLKKKWLRKWQWVCQQVTEKYKIYAFNKIVSHSNTQQNRQVTIKRILVLKDRFQSSLFSQNASLKRILSKTRTIKSQQLKKIVLIESAFHHNENLKVAWAFSKLKRMNNEVKSLQIKNQNQRTITFKDFQTKITRLSRAILPISCRSITKTQIHTYFLAIKGLQRQIKKILPFSKNDPFKNKKVVQTIEVKNRNIKLEKKSAIAFEFIVKKKLIQFQNQAFRHLKLMNNEKIPLHSSDSNIDFENKVVEHLLFLSDKVHQKSLQKKKFGRQKQRSLRLSIILLRIQKKEQKIKMMVIQGWRRMVSELHLQFASQINQLEKIKQQYSDM